MFCLLTQKSESEDTDDNKTADNKDNSSEKTDHSSTPDNNKMANEQKASDLETEEAKKLVDTLASDSSTKEIVKSAAEAVGSLSDSEFEVRFNPDMFQPHVKLADEEVRLGDCMAEYGIVVMERYTVLCTTNLNNMLVSF